MYISVHYRRCFVVAGAVTLLACMHVQGWFAIAARLSLINHLRADEAARNYVTNAPQDTGKLRWGRGRWEGGTQGVRRRGRGRKNKKAEGRTRATLPRLRPLTPFLNAALTPCSPLQPLSASCRASRNSVGW